MRRCSATSSRAPRLAGRPPPTGSSSRSSPSVLPCASFLLERLGTRVAAASVSIVDDGLLPGALGSRPFDGEGLATRRTVLVGEGALETYLLDTYSARKLG